MTSRHRQALLYAESLLAEGALEALLGPGPFRFPVPGEWSASKAEAFSTRVTSIVADEKSRAIASFALMVRSIGQLPREGAYTDAALARWGAGLVLALHNSEPTLLARRTMWTFPSTLHGNALLTLQAARMYFPPEEVSPEVASRLLESMDDHILRTAHAELRQDGQANALLWLDDLALRAAYHGKKAPPRPVDTLLQQPMGLEQLFEKMSAVGPRGDAGRRLMNRLAVRLAEPVGLDFMAARSGRIAEDAWRERPLKVLASELVNRAQGHGWSTTYVDQSLRDLSSITGIPLPEAAQRFGHHFCSAITERTHGSSWASLSRALVPEAGRPSPVEEVVACIERHQVLDLAFMRQLRSAFFNAQPDYLAGKEFEERFAPIEKALATALEMRSHIEASAPVASNSVAPPPATRARRLGL